MKPSRADRAIGETRRWLERLVIGENLCPFAAAPYRAGRVMFRVCEADNLDGVYVDFLQLLQDLVNSLVAGGLDALLPAVGLILFLGVLEALQLER